VRTHILLTIVGMGVATYLTRAPFLLAFSQRGLPEQVHRILRHIPVALLTALVVPMLLMPGGELSVTPRNPYLLGTLLTALVLRFTQNLFLVVFAGVAAVALFRLIVAL
jgi:branched-subunit amino acid transport protein